MATKDEQSEVKLERWLIHNISDLLDLKSGINGICIKKLQIYVIINMRVKLISMENIFSPGFILKGRQKRV